MKFKRLELDQEVVRELTPTEIGEVGGAATGGWICFIIQISVAICPTPTNAPCGGPPEVTTQGGETYTCAC